jgi:hypothetical protein
VVLLVSLCAVLVSACGKTARPVEGATTSRPRPAAEVDASGFIDVWQLRADVARVEPLIATDDSDGCYPEGDADDPAVLTPESIAADERAAKECERRVLEAYDTYRRARDALNTAWLPVLKDAIRRGDRVAEVILRQCQTTEVLDRSSIESTCDEDAARRRFAAERLKKIGFVPAMDIRDQLIRQDTTPRRKRYEHNQPIVLERVRGGALDFRISDVDPGGNIAPELEDVERFRVWALIEAASQEARRAFTFGADSTTPEEIANLRLNRKPHTPGVFTWGPALRTSNGSIYTGPHYWRSQPMRVYTAAGQVAASFGASADFQRDKNALLAAIESSVQRYLAEDLRWGVFLMNRAGHHEWIPERTASPTSQLEPAWEGTWTLVRETPDLTQGMRDGDGRASIVREGGTYRMSVVANNQPVGLDNVQGCELRLSGGSTFPPKMTPNGQNLHATAFGNFEASNADWRAAGSVYFVGAVGEALAPLDPMQTYKQVLMLCERGESVDSDRVRFLILAGDTLIEVGASSAFNSTLAIRHYRRD